MNILLITGTGTSVGKTITTAAIATCAMAAGRSVAVVKPVQTGVHDGEPGDIAAVRDLTGLDDVHELVRYAEPLAPATAARRAHQPGPDIADLAQDIRALRDRDLVLVEGAGGALVRFNEHGHTLLDLGIELARSGAQRTPVQAVLVTSCALGTLHATAATAQAIRSAGLNLEHLVIADWPGPGADLAQRCNLEDLPAYAHATVAGILATGMGQLAPADFRAKVHAMLGPPLGGALDAAEFSHRNPQHQ